MEFEAGKGYTTRDGHIARVSAVDSIGIYGAVWFDEDWWATCWTNEGLYRGGVQDGFDLMPPKLTKTKYMFLYADGMVGMSDYPSLYRSGCEVVGTAVVELVEGEFGFDLPLKRGV